VQVRLLNPEFEFITDWQKVISNYSQLCWTGAWI
jgi:hypothetical protein